MVQLLLEHSSRPENRASILVKGLLQHTPTVDGNFVGLEYLQEQPRGVYTVFADNDRGWATSLEDVWRIAWEGPMIPDPALGDTRLVVQQDITPERVYLVKEGKSIL